MLLYTEATLLAAMERAGGEPEDGREQGNVIAPGIGTSATRAGVIETLFRRRNVGTPAEKANCMTTILQQAACTLKTLLPHPFVINSAPLVKKYDH